MDRQEELIFAFGNFENAPTDGKSRRLKPVATENERYVPYSFQEFGMEVCCSASEAYVDSRNVTGSM
jgi:hypothetical protein